MTPEQHAEILRLARAITRANTARAKARAINARMKPHDDKVDEVNTALKNLLGQVRVCANCHGTGKVQLHNWKGGGTREQSCWQCVPYNVRHVRRDE